METVMQRPALCRVHSYNPPSYSPLLPTLNIMNIGKIPRNRSYRAKREEYRREKEAALYGLGHRFNYPV